jgi:hypothetical protein
MEIYTKGILRDRLQATLRSLTLGSVLSHSDNSGYVVRYSSKLPYRATSHTRQTLYTIGFGMLLIYKNKINKVDDSWQM